MARILVTGGCGFIGSHLCEALLARGDEVRVLDDLSTGTQANLAPGATLIVGDVGRPRDLRRAFADIDACIHLAAIASVERATREWLATHRTNLSATIAVFEAARAGAVPVVYASSAAVYGAGGDAPLDETSSRRPLSAYGADKLGCEQHALVASHVHGVATVGMRFFNVFGPRQDPSSPYAGVIALFGDKLHRGDVLTICGDGLQTRDFIYVGDVVAALLAALKAASVAAPIFNICTGRATSVRQLATVMAELYSTRLMIDHRPARAGDIRHSVGSSAKAQQALGFSARTLLRAGLQSTMAWLDAGRPGLVARTFRAPPPHVTARPDAVRIRIAS